MPVAARESDPAADEILWNVIEQHLNEAEFQAEAFERAVESPAFTLDSLARGPEWFLKAHVDGLAVGGALVLEQTLLPVVHAPDPAVPGLITAVALVLVESGQLERFGELLSHGDPQVRRAAARGGGLAGNAQADTWVRSRLRSASPSNHLAGTLAYLAQRREQLANPLFEWLQHGDPIVVAAAAEAAGTCDPCGHGSLLEWLLEHTAPEVQKAAVLPAVLAGSRRAWSLLQQSMGTGAAPAQAGQAALFAALGGPQEHQLLASHLSSAKSRYASLFALGFSGNAELVPTLLPFLEDKDRDIRRVAAQSLAAIGGLHLLGDDYQTRSSGQGDARDLPPVEDDPEALAALPPLDADDLDTAPFMPPEAALTEPNPEAFATWYKVEGSRLPARSRLLAGKPFSLSTLRLFLREAPLRLREPVALSLVARSKGRARVDTRAFTATQHAQLRALEGLDDRDLVGFVGGW
ncbi:MAG TPA: HEAT repeat domain-containing protein [Polyangia bacterium]